MSSDHQISNPSSHGRTDWKGIAQAVTLVVLTCLCYWQTLDGGFFWDDRLCIPIDPSAPSPAGLRDIWLSTRPPDYYPLTYTTFWLEWQLWGHQPLGYHVVGLLLGLLNVFLVWTLLARLRLPGAWLGALLFAVHPLNVSSVAWIAETKNTLSTALYLGCLLVFTRAEAAPTSRARTGWHAAALLAFVLAALSKSSVVMLPCVLLLLAWWKRGRISRMDLGKSAPFFLVSFITGLITVWFHHHRAMDLNDPQASLPFWERPLVAGHALLFYMTKALVPVRLSMIYPRWEVDPHSLIAYAPVIAVIVLVAAAWKYREHWRRGPAAGLAYFILTLLPVSGLLSAALFKHSYVFDHLAYLATIGTSAGLAALLTHWRLVRAGSYLPVAAMGLVVGLFVLGALNRAKDFGSAEALWRGTLNIAPGSAAAHNNLGLALLEKRNFSEAATHFRAAMLADPYASQAAASNLARTLQDQGDWHRAEVAYATALARHPDAKDYNNYGVVLLELGEVERAGEQFEHSAQLDPRVLSPHFNLYKIALFRGVLADAVNELEVCLTINADDAPSLLGLAALDVQVATPGQTPPAAVVLAQRTCRIEGSCDPVALAVLRHAESPLPVANELARFPAIAARIDGIVRRLPALPRQ